MVVAGGGTSTHVRSSVVGGEGGPRANSFLLSLKNIGFVAFGVTSINAADCITGRPVRAARTHTYPPRSSTYTQTLKYSCVNEIIWERGKHQRLRLFNGPLATW